MLQTLRDNLKGTVAIIIVGLMIIPFALFGVDSLFLQDNSAGKAAEVNGEVISEMQLARAVQMQKQQIIQRFGDQAPAELLADDQLRSPVLTRLVRRELLRQAASEGGMAVSEQAIDQLIVQTPQFQSDGKFSPELYTQLLRNMGYTPSSYRNLLVEDILVNQHATAVTNSAFATEYDLRRLTALSQQKRSFYYITLPFESARNDIEISDGEISDYYASNRAEFLTPEQVSVEYIELSLDEMAAQVYIDPATIEAQFQQELARFESSVQRHAAHILIEESDESQQKIAVLQAKLEAGESFEDLAAEYSDDLGSRELGGDLGITDGSAFPESFEEALAALAVGEVSEVVETDAGYHFIKLLDKEESQPPQLEDVRDSIRENLAFAEAESEFVELLDALPDATYNVSSLEDAAQQLGLRARVSEYFDRNSASGVLANNQVRAAIFSDEVYNEGLSSNVIEISDNHLVVVRVRDKKAESLKPFEEVEGEILDLLTRQKVEVLLSERAEGLRQLLEQGEEIQLLSEQQGLPWQVKAGVMRNDSSIEADLLSHVFGLPKPQASPVNSTLSLPNGDFAVVQLTVVEAGKLPELDDQQLSTFSRRLGQEYGNADMQLYQAALDVRADIEVYE